MAATATVPRLHLRRARWRPRVSIGGAFCGLLAAVGGMVFEQQSGKLYPTGTVALTAIAGGLLVPQVLTNLGRVVAVARANRKIARAEVALAPRLAPVAAAPVATAAAAARPRRPRPPAPSKGWQPTHTVPEGGLDAWTDPDPDAAPVASLDASLEVKVVETQGAWARVLCENGWEGWTDARELKAVSR